MYSPLTTHYSPINKQLFPEGAQLLCLTEKIFSVTLRFDRKGRRSFELCPGWLSTCLTNSSYVIDIIICRRELIFVTR